MRQDHGCVFVHSPWCSEMESKVVSMQGTVLIHNAQELESYSRSEEDRLEAIIKSIADTGAKVIVAGSAIGEMALHFVEKYSMMAVRIPSKFDLRRFCRCAKCPHDPWFVELHLYVSAVWQDAVTACLILHLHQQKKQVL